MKMNQCKKTQFFCGSIAEKKLYWVCRVELESHPHVCLLPGEWSFPSAPCVGIMFDRTVPAMSHLACFFCSYSRWIEYFLMCVGSILSFPSVSFFSPILYLWCVMYDPKSSNHSISIPLSSLLFLFSLTLLSSSSSLFQPSSHYCVAVCDCVSSPLYFSSSSPSSLGEGANALGAWGGNSPARRGDWGEILLISRSSGELPVCSLDTNAK